jgi:hypothetical protein
LSIAASTLAQRSGGKRRDYARSLNTDLSLENERCVVLARNRTEAADAKTNRCDTLTMSAKRAILPINHSVTASALCSVA